MKKRIENIPANPLGRSYHPRDMVYVNDMIIERKQVLITDDDQVYTCTELADVELNTRSSKE